MKIDIKEAFKKPLNDKAWLIKVLIGGLILSIPIIGHILADGYLILYLSLLLTSDDQKLPKWTDVGVILKLSMKLIVVWIVYCLPLIAFSFIIDPYYPLDVTAMATSIEMRAIISLPIALLIKFFLNVAYVRFAQNNFKISAALNIKEVFSLLKANIKGYKVVYIYDAILFLIIVLSLIVFISKSGWVVNFIQVLMGVFLFYAYLTINNMLGMVFGKEE